MFTHSKNSIVWFMFSYSDHISDQMIIPKLQKRVSALISYFPVARREHMNKTTTITLLSSTYLTQ